MTFSPSHSARYTSLFSLCLVLFVGIVCLSPSALAQGVDLTGEWQADNGTRYFLRQLGTELFWSMDSRPRVANVFAGRIEGSTIIGRWVDVPGGQLMNSGTLTLRIESPDRLVKVSSSIAYAESTWTRVGASAAPPPPTGPSSGVPTPVSWGSQADPWRGQNGRRETLSCSAGGPTAGRLWGTDIYTDDSSICLAAVHAGLITAVAGGTVTIEIRPGQPSYTGSTRNGVTSNAYGSWTGSFAFVGGGSAAAPPPPPAVPAPPTAAPSPPMSGPTTIVATWGTQADAWRGQNGRRETLTCPPGGPTGGRLWGTDIYTDDSSICLAAVHAGLISVASGGTVTIEIRPGQPSYTGSTRNFITSTAYGSYAGSFAFVGAPAGGSPAPPPPAPAPTGATWGTQADQWRGKNGSRQTLVCPPGGPTAGRLWGTDTYTDDSSICLAATHAGLITAAAGGTVTIEIQPGQAGYTGSTRNGVASNAYGGWPGSFVFVGGISGGGVPGTGAAGGICDDPKTLAIMDEWLGRALPPQSEGESLRYESWGRLVGRSKSATITVPGPPDTRLSRCEYLWQYAAQLQSTNLGNLRDYVTSRR